MNVLIETYKEFDIFFNLNDEQFYCTFNNEHGKRSKSFSAVKLSIDQYIKENVKFVPFKIRRNGKWENNGVTDEIRTVIGIHGNGNFIFKNDKGKLEQISSYENNGWILEEFVNENDVVECRLKELEVDEKQKELKELCKKIKKVTLEDYIKQQNKNV